jgi:hypothetical protein
MENRESVKQELGKDARVADIAKVTSQRWKSLPEAERKHWENISQADRDRYKEEKAAYTGPLLLPNEKDVKKRRKHGKKWKKDPAAPKRPVTAFLYFSQQVRPTLQEKKPGIRVAEISQELGRMWREMTEEDRKPYFDHEDIVRKKWREERAKYLEAKEKAAADSVREEAKKPQKPKEPVAPKVRKEKKKPPKQSTKAPDSNDQEKQAPIQRHPPQRDHTSVHDMYRQQVADDVYSNMSRGPGPSVFAGMLSQPEQGMMGMGYSGGMGGPSAAAYLQAQQQAFYGDSLGPSRYSASMGSTPGMGGMAVMGGQDVDVGGISSSGMTGLSSYGSSSGYGSSLGMVGLGGGGIPSGMGMYGKQFRFCVRSY